MKCKVVFGIVLLCSIITFAQLSPNPETQPTIQEKCSLQDSACLTTQAQNTLQIFVEGIPELGIKTIDKLLVDPVIVHVGNFSYNWTDIRIAGLKDAIIDDVSINMLLKIMRVSFHTTLNMDFHYSSDGMLFSTFYVYGSGPGRITLNKMQMEILFVFDIIKENGQDFMDLKTSYYGFDTGGGVHFNFENVFNGDEKKSKILHSFLNVNWRSLMSNFGGYFNRKITDKLFEALKIYMRSKPLTDLVV